MTDDSHNLRNPTTRPHRPGPATRDDQTPTIRTTPVDLNPDALPDEAAHYVGPQPLPRTSEHKTIDMAPVRLAPEINPRLAPTQRLSPVPPRRKASGLLLGAVLAALVIAALFVGARRLLGRASTSQMVGTSARVLPLALPSQAPAPAAAMIAEPAHAQSAAAVPRPSPAASPAPAPKRATKQREVWLE